jgi:hypothetical protein
MLSIAELAHQRDPVAIAEVIRQELQGLDINTNLDHPLDHLNVDDVEVNIVDSSLEIQIRTNSAIDKEKLLTLVRKQLQNLHIKSVAKFRIHCWRNDEEMYEQRLLWTEQFMLERPISSSSQVLELEPDITRSPETQLSKHSVLQQAIAQISPTNLKAKKDLLAEEVAEQNADQIAKQNAVDSNVSNSSVSLNSTDNQKTGEQKTKTSSLISESDHNYWQLLLVGLSIVLLGLGIGAFAKAITLKNGVDKSSSIQPITQSSESPIITTKIPPKTNNLASPETTTPSPNISETSTSPSPVVLPQDELIVTLEKFNRIQKGMTIEQVEKILGTSGKIIAENNSVDNVGKVYSWKNPQGSNAIVEFKDGQVVAKAQAGL